MTSPLVQVDELVVTTSSGRRLIDGVSFELSARSRTGLIGESGSGKSLTALSLLGLLPDGLSASGRITFGGRELTSLPERQMCEVRGNDISMIFQEPMTALNPVMRVGKQIAEALRMHQGLDRSGASDRVLELFQAVGIPQLHKCDRFGTIRQRYATLYNEGFKEVPEITVPYVAEDVEHAWHLYVIQLDLERLRIGRNEMIDLLKKQGIGTSVHFIPLHLHPYYSNISTYTYENFPVANQAFKRIISLPIYPRMTDAGVQHVIDVVTRLIQENRR